MVHKWMLSLLFVYIVYALLLSVVALDFISLSLYLFFPLLLFMNPKTFTNNMSYFVPFVIAKS